MKREREVLDRVVAEILSSRKYASVAPEVVRRVAEEALCVAGSEREAAKRTRRKLHQAYGAFGRAVDHGRIEALVGAIEVLPREPRAAWRAAVSEASREILGFHVSTAERLPFLGELYRSVLDPSLGPGARILDLGCGLNPFALPWMDLPADCEYHAVDVDTKLAVLVGRYLAASGRSGSATTADILAREIPRGPWDAVLLLKMVPTLERQERGSASRLIRSLDAARIVVSFPRASLGGRRKGMDAQYEALMGTVVEGASLDLERHAWAGESVYVCRRKGASASAASAPVSRP
jgi:16S rRNA (guanine(1405)-N(7))-methyltransferase